MGAVGPWHAGGLDLRPTLALLARADYTPDFLTPPPGSPLASIEDGLEVNRLVKALAEYWERAFAPSWPRVRALLEADTSAEIAELHMDPQT